MVTTIDLGANDILPNGTDTTFTIINGPFGGTVNNLGNGIIDYFPNDGVGADSFQYVVCVVVNGDTLCDTAWVYLLILEEFYIPNGFSPNGDGVNDVFAIPFLDLEYPDATINVFNRWGDEVWFSNGPYQNDWDGSRMNGEELPDGTYYFILEFNDGQTEPIIKFVVIHR